MIYSYNTSQQDALFLYFILVKNSTCFVQAYSPSSGVLILYTQQLVFVIQVMLTLLARSGPELAGILFAFILRMYVYLYVYACWFLCTGADLPFCLTLVTGTIDCEVVN